jgi:dTDP-6-deoxy-L-talose 4-dehydrogenase (NAD+)
MESQLRDCQSTQFSFFEWNKIRNSCTNAFNLQMKIAITGATGFIGGHVRRRLALTDNEVVLGVRNLKRLGEIAINETPVEMDISHEGTNWFEILGKPDAVLHLAWGGLPNYVDPVHVDIELPMQIKFLEGLVSSGLSNLVVTGTCYEYGPANGPLSEKHITDPNTSYGVAKDTLRKDLFALQSTQNFELTWARIFYPFGQGQSDSSLYSQLANRAITKNGELEIGNPQSVLDFVPVEDVAFALSKLVEQKEGLGVINLGSGVPTSVEDFVKKVISQHSWQVRIKHGSNGKRNYEPKAFWADASKLQEFLSRI